MMSFNKLKNNRSYIYCIINLINNRVYIGKSNNPNERFRAHKKISKGGVSKYPNDFFIIHGAMKKYGIDNFKLKILEEFSTEQEAYIYEMWWIDYFGSCNREFGYNLHSGGEGGTRPCKETSEKKSNAQRGSKNHRAILSEKLVLEIINKYISGKYSQKQLSIIYSIHKATINDIFTHKTWTHLTKNVVCKNTTLSLSRNHNKVENVSVIMGDFNDYK